MAGLGGVPAAHYVCAATIYARNMPWHTENPPTAKVSGFVLRLINIYIPVRLCEMHQVAVNIERGLYFFCIHSAIDYRFTDSFQ